MKIFFIKKQKWVLKVKCHEVLIGLIITFLGVMFNLKPTHNEIEK